jgi:hypothetical protein
VEKRTAAVGFSTASVVSGLAVFADLAVHSDAAAMLLRDYVMGDRKAEARPSPASVQRGGHEQVEAKTFGQ